MRKAAILIATILAGGSVGSALAKPLTYVLPDETAELRPAKHPGFEAAQNNCLACHSADYVLTQPPKSGPGFWQATVTKMVKVYRAPIDEADAKAISDYLAQTY
ncbi:cytochrome c [Enterovirga sp.]|uniref:SorB family sulfite dehydrogenase c-type cytochrome subunit n=1 Tax=Enterovirga sp. TaxID=2026350 RepID=UPI002B7D4E27|nr:cytochrome c [Enterovirga sp.]HMO28480.1 cytochrome c [Enterovirga sp.]